MARQRDRTCWRASRKEAPQLLPRAARKRALAPKVIAPTRGVLVPPSSETWTPQVRPGLPGAHRGDVAAPAAKDDEPPSSTASRTHIRGRAFWYAQSTVIDLTGLSILDIHGAEKIRLDGSFDAPSLSERLVEEWVPFVECHKCGRFDYCKFVRRYPDDPDHAEEIRCGITTTALQRFISSTFKHVASAQLSDRQRYLDAAYHFTQFAHKAEGQLGLIQDREMVEYWGDLQPMVFSQLINLREHLDGMAEALRTLSVFRSQQAVLFLEGYSEEAFIDTLRMSRLTWFLDLRVVVYGGRSNARPSRMRMLLDHYKRTGYDVFVECDADGRSSHPCATLVHENALPQERTFAFRYDFETAIPSALLVEGLHRLDLLAGVNAADLDCERNGADCSVVRLLEEKHGLDLAPWKTDLAMLVADQLNEDWSWSRNTSFLSSELGQFIQFLQRVHAERFRSAPSRPLVQREALPGRVDDSE